MKWIYQSQKQTQHVVIYFALESSRTLRNIRFMMLGTLYGLLCSLYNRAADGHAQTCFGQLNSYNLQSENS